MQRHGQQPGAPLAHLQEEAAQPLVEQAEHPQGAQPGQALVQPGQCPVGKPTPGGPAQQEMPCLAQSTTQQTSSRSGPEDSTQQTQPGLILLAYGLTRLAFLHLLQPAPSTSYVGSRQVRAHTGPALRPSCNVAWPLLPDILHSYAAAPAQKHRAVGQCRLRSPCRLLHRHHSLLVSICSSATPLLATSPVRCDAAQSSILHTRSPASSCLPFTPLCCRRDSCCHVACPSRSMICQAQHHMKATVA